MITCCLPKQSLWHGVTTGLNVTRRGLLYRLLCPHAVQTTYAHVDHTSNPPPSQDVYEGKACVDCGAVLTRKQTY